MIRVSPHDFDVEQSLIGAALLDNGVLDGVGEIARPEHFADPLHGKVYSALQSLVASGRSINAVMLKAHLGGDEDLARAGGDRYLAKLLVQSVHARDAVGLAQQVRDLWTRR